jgi:hypothetical protein
MAEEGIKASRREGLGQEWGRQRGRHLLECLAGNLFPLAVGGGDGTLAGLWRSKRKSGHCYR